MQNAGLDEAESGIKTARRNINNLRYADDILMAESKENLKGILIQVNDDCRHKIFLNVCSLEEKL